MIPQVRELVPNAAGTIWYMGAKTRLLADLERAIAPLLDAAATRRTGRKPALVDLFAGTGVVGAQFADRARVIAADAQRYAAVLAGSLLVPAAGVEAAVERVVERAEAAREAIAAHFAGPLASERTFVHGDEDARGFMARYRRFIERDLAANDPEQEAAHGLFAAYYRNVYFGVAQAVALDALRRAIDGEPEPRRTTLLAALLFAASRATSGTSHFAQPRGLEKESELRAMLGRRRIDVVELFRARVAWLAKAARRAKAGGPHEAVAGPYERVLERIRPGEVDVVYADPPYTTDNYSRFYHVLEVLVAYDRPPLAKNARGELLRGRYPPLERRFQSAFTLPDAVEGEFRRVTGLAAARGAALVWSYSRTNGLLLKLWGGDVERFRGLLLESYAEVRVEERELHHSGSGDKNHLATELIAICTRPRETCAT